MKIFVSSQYMENYGDAENPHWKFKGDFTVFCKAENGRSELYYQNLADKLAEHAVWDGEMTQAYGADVYILEDNQEHYNEKMYREHAEGEYAQGDGIYKPDRTFTEQQLMGE